MEPFKQCNSYMVFDERQAWDFANISNTKFEDCIFKNITIDKIDITDCAFQGCTFENINIKNILGDSHNGIVDCKFINCNIELASYLRGTLRGCSFVFTS